MMAEFSHYRTFASPAQVLAQAYGTDSYSGNSYNGATATAPAPAPTPAPTTGTGLLAPSTGFFAQPPIVTVPVLLVVAIIVGSLSFTISRLLRRRRSHKS